MLAKLAFCEMLSQYPRSAFRGSGGFTRGGQQQLATQPSASIVNVLLVVNLLTHCDVLSRPPLGRPQFPGFYRLFSCIGSVQGVVNLGAAGVCDPNPRVCVPGLACASWPFRAKRILGSVAPNSVPKVPITLGILKAIFSLVKVVYLASLRFFFKCSKYTL